MKLRRIPLALPAAALSAALVLPGFASAQTADRVISNTATVSWNPSTGGVVTRTSNRVDVTVRAAPPAPASAGIFRISAPGTGRDTLLGGTGCTLANGSNGSIGSSEDRSTGFAGENRFTVGETVGFGVTSPSDNRDSTLRETLAVTIRTDNGDEEQLTLREDSANSGFFVGYLPSVPMPPAVQQRDCRLSVMPGRELQVTLVHGITAIDISTATISFLVDPFGIVFDSGDGAPVPGSTVTIVDATTGAPAQVFGDDGVSAYPSSIVTGSTVTDSSGRTYVFPPGDYRFPFVAPGRYRLVVAPPAPYRAPSIATPAELAGFRRPDNGLPYTINTASYGAVFELFTPEPVRIDIPVDRDGDALVISKLSATQAAFAGDVVRYTISVSGADVRRGTGAITVTDTLPNAMRLRADTVRLDGALVTPLVAPDGRQFSVQVPALVAGGRARITYLAEIRPDAAPGDAINLALARDTRGAVSNTADAAVRIRRDVLGDRITIIGRVTRGGCAVDPHDAPGAAGVRVMLQDGSFTVTDRDGRYHFEGVLPGLHVVAIDPATFGNGAQAIDCAQNVRNAGSPVSRFVDGRGGDLRRADFRLLGNETELVLPDAPQSDDVGAERPVEGAETPSESRRPSREDAGPRLPDGISVPLSTASQAAGSDRDWFAGLTPGVRWLFPEPEHNPRSSAVRIAIAHLPGQRVELLLRGRAVDPIAFEGVTTGNSGASAVSLWRGVEISDGNNDFTANVYNADGSLAQTLTNIVHFSTPPMMATLLRDRSRLVADGVQRPIIAVRLTDRAGRPIRQGVVGDFSVAAPHRAAQDLDAEQARQLSGLDRSGATWYVPGDDGVAYIELEPTTASGTIRLDFEFRDGEITRRHNVDGWLNPGNRPWTVVGFAAGTLGYNTLNDRMEPVAETLPDDNVDGRIALYAQGRIRGDWLLTMSYDSDREAEEARFGGVIDPRAYYTVYADRADRGFDAASVRNLYLRLERPQFVALFGDFETALNDTELTRYQRAMNGLRAEYRSDQFAATAFAADTPYRHRRDELQGSGLSGPYQLGARGILANSERITIETRDRLRSNLIVDRRTLTRHIDYDIDYFAGTLRFREPILSRDSALNPQFIIADYEVDGVGQRVTNAGGRVAWRTTDDSLRIGATAIHDETDVGQTNMGGLDLRYRPSASTEIRAEFALSNTRTDVAPAATDERAHAWLVEVEHHGSHWDMLAYAREQQDGFGVGQIAGGQNGSRRIGFDGRVRLDENFSLTGSLWQDVRLTTGASRYAGRALGEYRIDDTTLRAGLTFADDELADGTRNSSTLVQLGASQRLLGGRLELDGQTEFVFGGDDESIDFPTRHRVGARYSLTQDAAIVGAYEIADGGNVDARTLRVGVDVRPWAGARLAVSGNQQDFVELGERSFAAYGLTQSFLINENLSADVTVDGQRTLSGINAADVLELEQPVASGGFIGTQGLLTEDFLALTAGATWRSDRWSITGRAEYRDGELTNRYGMTLGMIRQIGEGRALGGLFTYTEAQAETGLATRTISGEMSWAHRPDDSRLSWLNRFEVRGDRILGSIAGQPGPIGGPVLTLDGDARSTRVINSLSINYSPMGQDDDDGLWSERGEYTLFLGARYASDRIGEDDVSGWSAVVGGDIRFDLDDWVGVGVAGNLRIATDARARSYAIGPQIVLSPFQNANLVIGYNIAGYRDRDFEEARYSRAGIYATLRIKFDQTTLQGLGLTR